MLVARQNFADYRGEQEPVSYGRRKIKKAGSVQEKLAVVGCVLLALVTGLMLTATHAQITSKSNNIIQLKQEISDLQNSNGRLKLEIARLKSLDRIESIARNELGMVQPGMKDIQYLASETKDGAEKVASGAGADQEENKISVDVHSGKSAHPLLLAVNRIFANYVFHAGHSQPES